MRASTSFCRGPARSSGTAASRALSALRPSVVVRSLLILFLVLWFCSGLCSVPGVQAATWLVKPDGTGDFATIQDAIGNAARGDTVLLANGVFTGDGNRDLHYWGKPLVISSQSGDPAYCALDCQGAPGNDHRAFTFDWSEGPTSVLRGVTIRNGYLAGTPPPDPMDCGGAILVTNHSQPTLVDLVFQNNRSYWGAVAILESGGTFLRCTFVGNQGWWTAGGVKVFGGTANFQDCIFRENAGGQGGGGISSGYDSHIVV
jgi:hypothetical protein